MGMISIYTYSSYILHILSTQSTQTNHIRRLPCSLPFPIFIASQYISCRFLAGVPFPRSRILFSPAPSVSAPVVPFSVMPPLRSFRSYRFPVSSGRLVMRVVSSFPVPSYRSVRRVVVPFLVSFMPGRRNGAPFLSARFLVPSLSHRGVRFPGAACLPFRSSSRCGVAVLRFVHRPVRRLVVAFRASLRLVGRLVRRLVRRLVSSLVFSRRVRLVVRFSLFVIAHQMRASPLRFVVGIGRNVSLKRRSPSLVSCSILIRAVFPSSVSRRGVGEAVVPDYPLERGRWCRCPHSLRSSPFVLRRHCRSRLVVRPRRIVMGVSSVDPSRLAVGRLVFSAVLSWRPVRRGACYRLPLIGTRRFSQLNFARRFFHL